MLDHIDQATKADRIREALADHPEMSSSQIAAMLDVRPEYVRVVNARRTQPRTSRGRVASALLIAKQTYSDALASRRAAEADWQDSDAQARYRQAWELHKAAEKVYLELSKAPMAMERRGVDQLPVLRGVSVRKLMEQQMGWVPIMGTVK